MQVALFSSTDEGGLAPAWTNETVIVLFGGTKLDLTKRPPEPDATLTVVAVFGEAKVIVPAGSRLTVRGLSLFGARQVRVQPGTGPDLGLRAFTLFGSVDVTEAPGSRTGAEKRAEAGEKGQVFPY